MDNNTSNSLAQDKVLILYVLDKIKYNITESDLFRLTSSINNINYFSFKQILSDLVDSKLIETYTKDEENEDNQAIYKLTNEGYEFFDLTIDVLPGLLKLKADTVLKNEIRNLITEDSIVTEFTPENENCYIVKCKIRENNKTIFEVKILATSNEQAKLISDNWKQNANSIYPKVLDMFV